MVLTFALVFVAVSCKPPAKKGSSNSGQDQSDDANIAEDNVIESAAESFTTLSMENDLIISDEEANDIEAVVTEDSAIDSAFIDRVSSYIFTQISQGDSDKLGAIATDLVKPGSTADVVNVPGSTSEVVTVPGSSAEDSKQKIEDIKAKILGNAWLQKMANGDQNKMNDFLTKISKNGRFDKKSIRAHIDQVVVRNKDKRKRYVRTTNRKMDLRRHKIPDLPFIIYADTQANRLASEIATMQANKTLSTDQQVSNHVQTKVLQTVNSNLDLMRQFKRTIADKMGKDKAKRFRVDGSLEQKAKRAVQDSLIPSLQIHIFDKKLISDQAVYSDMIAKIRIGAYLRLKSSMDIIRQQAAE